jgi:hypothetical protein
MSANYIQPPANTGTGLKIDTSELNVGANVVERQNVVIGDPTTDVGLATIQTINSVKGLAVAPYNPDNFKATYGAAATAFSAGTAATSDIFTIYGSGTKTVRVTRLVVSSTTATAAVYYDLVLAKRSTIPTGGASSSPSVVPYDSAFAAGTATVKNWTAAPTAGTNVGTMAVVRTFSPLTGTAALTPPPVVFDFANRPSSAAVLRGTGEGLAVTINGVTPANAQTWDIFVEWTEE